MPIALNINPPGLIWNHHWARAHQYWHHFNGSNIIFPWYQLQPSNQHVIQFTGNSIDRKDNTLVGASTTRQLFPWHLSLPSKPSCLGIFTMPKVSEHHVALRCEQPRTKPVTAARKQKKRTPQEANPRVDKWVGHQPIKHPLVFQNQALLKSNRIRPPPHLWTVAAAMLFGGTNSPPPRGEEE